MPVLGNRNRVAIMCQDGSDIDLVGYCSYCKNKVYKNQEYKIKLYHGHEHVYHLECWNLDHNIIEELNFED
jgi:hypothetical protein